MIKKISLDKWKRNKTLRLIKIAFGGKNDKKKKGTRNIK
tara:strand:+ start:924 stop:1040 length:117 start_codon:yes stop_codon:yes gene_type:complete